MNRRLTVSAVCAVALSLGVVTLRGEAPPKPASASAKASANAGLRSALVGTWKMTSMKVNGRQSDLPERSVTYKHVTPGGFTWLSFNKEDGKIYRAAGGTYTLTGEEYTETIQYGVGNDFDTVRNASHPFKCHIDGDTWHHTGRLAGGTTLDEVWTRVKPEAATASSSGK